MRACAALLPESSVSVRGLALAWLSRDAAAEEWIAARASEADHAGLVSLRERLERVLGEPASTAIQLAFEAERRGGARAHRLLTSRGLRHAFGTVRDVPVGDSRVRSGDVAARPAAAGPLRRVRAGRRCDLPGVPGRARGSARRSAPAAGRRRRGPSSAAANARGGGSRSPGHGPRVAYEGAAISPRPLAWKDGGRRGLAASPRPRSRRGRAPRRRGDRVRSAVRARELWRGHNTAAALAPSSPASGSCRWPRCSTAWPSRARSAGSDWPSGAATSRAPSWRGAPCPPRWLLCDDVYTSGATAAAAASALRRVGAARVEVVTFARALRGGGSRGRP